MPCHLVVSGFHVIYFNSAELQVRLGRFDLRNVLLLQPLGGGADDCIKLTVREGAGKDKHIVLMFANEDKAEWLALMTSAVAESHVSELLRGWRVAGLAAHLDLEHGGDAALMSTILNKPSCLTPRNGPQADAPAKTEQTATGAQESKGRKLLARASSFDMARRRAPRESSMAAPAAAAPAAASLPLRLKRAGSFGRSRKTLEVDETGQGGETGTSMKPVVVRRASSWSRLRSDRAQRREVANAARGALSRAQTEVQGPSDAQTEEAATEHAPAALSALEAVDRTQEWLETHGEPAAVSADTPIAYLHDDVSARPSVVLTQALHIFGSMDEEEQEGREVQRRPQAPPEKGRSLKLSESWAVLTEGKVVLSEKV